MSMRPKPITALPIGDSITLGWDERSQSFQGGYGPALQRNLRTDGIQILSPVGHGGYTCDQIAALIDAPLQKEQPDYVLLEAGTNDGLHTKESPSQALSHLQELVERIHSDSPQSIILVSTLPPIASKNPWGASPNWIQTFNHLLPETLSAYATVVDVGGALSINDLGPRGVHPAPSGYRNMASRWADVLNRQIDSRHD